MNLSDLDRAIGILYQPGGQNTPLLPQAQQYCQSFISSYSSNLLGLLQLFEDEKFQNEMQELSKFCLLQAICDIAKNQETQNQGLPSAESRASFHARYFAILRDKYQIVLQAKHTLSKYALLFVLMVKWDFPEHCPEAFGNLLSLMTVSQDLERQKLYLRFITQVMLMVDEELVERHESQYNYNNEKSNNVKDGIRAGPIQEICNILYQAISNYQIFDQGTVNDCLHVAAQLIDWNLLGHFESIVLIAKQMIGMKPFRKNCMQVIHSVVNKGMDYDAKIDVLVGLQYIELIESFELKYRERSTKPSEEDDQLEEEEFFVAVADSVNRMGNWCLELFMHHDKLLADPSHQQHYEVIFARLLKHSIENLLNTDKPKIGRPIVDFIQYWLQAIKKLETLNDFNGQLLIQLMKIVVLRASFTRWFQFKEDDQTDYEEDYLRYREELVSSLFNNIATVKSFNHSLLQMLAELLQQVSPKTMSFHQAEVVLFLIYNLQQSIPGDLREKASDSNPYSQLIHFVFQIDFISSFNHPSVTLMYLELLVRYNTYLLPLPNFPEQVCTIIFSEKGLLSKDSKLAKRSSYIFLRLCERFVSVTTTSRATAGYIGSLLQKTVDMIQLIETRAQKLHLGPEDALNLYNVLALYVSSKNIDVSLRGAVFQKIQSGLSEKLLYLVTKNNDLEKLHCTLKYLNTFSKMLQPSSIEVFGSELQLQVKQTLEIVLRAMVQNIKQPLICDQCLQYLQRCVTLMGSLAVTLVTETGLFYLNQVEFDRLEAFINILTFTVQTVKAESISLVSLLFNILYQRVIAAGIPLTDTSDADKSILRCISSFIRFVSSIIETLDQTVGLKLLPDGLTDWVLGNFEQNPDKLVKKSIAQAFKELLTQISGVKHSSAYKDHIAQILNLSKKTLVNVPAEGGVTQSVTDLSTLEPRYQKIVEQSLMLATRAIFPLNPAVLDDLQIIKTLADIQLMFLVLGLKEQVRSYLAEAGSTLRLTSSSTTEQLIQLMEQWLTSSAGSSPQIRLFHEAYAKALKQLRNLSSK